MFKPRQKVLIRPNYEIKLKPGEWQYRNESYDDTDFREGIITAKCTGPYYSVRFNDGWTDKVHEKDIMKHSRALRALYVNPQNNLQSESGQSSSWDEYAQF